MDTVPTLNDNNNFVETSQLHQMQASPNSLLNEKIGGLCMDSSDGNEFLFNNECNEQQLMQVIQYKSSRILELETLLRQKEDEIAELKSHLDKFQSVFPFSRGNRKSGQRGVNGQRQRAQGISAEPQSESSVLELLHVTFPKYDKDER